MTAMAWSAKIAVNYVSNSIYKRRTNKRRADRETCLTKPRFPE